MTLNNVYLYAAAFGLANAHSWIHCSDYRGNRAKYDPEACFGHPRPMNGRVPDMTAFGTDIGYNEQPSTTCNMGASPPLGNYPMARYKQGQEVVLAWPSKNHVAASCTNAWIPDTSLELFIAAEDADGHPDNFVKIPASFSDDPHVKGQMDFKGFQNCPDFCNNMDKSLCTGSFFVPVNLPDGTYTFQWKWEFNAGTAPYITCFEAYIGQDVEPGMSPVPAPDAGQPAQDGDTPAPVPAPVQDDCAASEWEQCGGPGHEGKCCAGGRPCQRQSQWYSQCRNDCPPGWECANSVEDKNEPGAMPAPAPEEDPEEASEESVPAESDSDSGEACDPDMSCAASVGIEGRLVKPVDPTTQAVLPSACKCMQFCKLFGDDAKFWSHKSPTGKCECFKSATRVKANSGDMRSGELSEQSVGDEN